MRRFGSFFLALILCFEPALGYAQVLVGGQALPAPGQMIHCSSASQPILMRGLTIDSSRPLSIDFIVDPGSGPTDKDVLKAESQRMINYFLAALAVPQKDLWVNLSPVESERIIPDDLIRTEMGRDLLAQDYVLKQLTASLIYPEDNLGRDFWQKLYAQAFEKFGVRDLPVDAFNKVWIVPQRARVFEKGSTVFITGVEMKVMLDADHQALQANDQAAGTPEEELTKNILRELIVPAIEREVNEGANFARLRQVVYALVLAQWYQDALRDSVLNKAYSGKSKVAGIDLSDPQNKQLIYEQYMAAYRTGVFNYIKEETDPVTGEDLPRKYFSGGFVVGDIQQDAAQAQEVEVFAKRPLQRIAASLEAVDASQQPEFQPGRDFIPETQERWNAIERFEAVQGELSAQGDKNDTEYAENMDRLLARYSRQYDEEVRRKNPVQGMWAVTKAVALLPQDQIDRLMDFLEQKESASRTRLMNMMLLMGGRYSMDFVRKNIPALENITYYFATVEMDHKQGGLGPVNETHSMFLHRLGAKVRFIQLKYAMRFDTGVAEGEPLQYEADGPSARNLGVTNMKEVDRFRIDVGPDKGVEVIVEYGENRAGVPGYYIHDAGNKYANRAYRYRSAEAPNNPVSMPESVAFFALAVEQFMSREQGKNKKDDGSYPFIILHTQDGQVGPLVQTLRDHRLPGLEPENIVVLDTTHTILNAQTLSADDARHLAERLLGLSPEYIAASFIDKWWDGNAGAPAHSQGLFGNLTYGGLRLADAGLGVSRSHARDMEKLYELPLVGVTNGDNPQQIAAFLEETFRQMQLSGEIAENVDIDNMQPQEVIRLKKKTAERYNDLKVRTANGEVLEAEARSRYGRSIERLTESELGVILGWANDTLSAGFTSRDQLREALYVRVNTSNPVLGNARRLVDEKNAYDPYDLIPMLVDMGYSVVIQGNLQDSDASRELARKYRDIELRINRERRESMARGSVRYPGQFFFVQHFTEEEKIALLGAINGQIMLNKRTLGAHETLEENPQPNMVIQIAFDHRDGGTTDNMKPWSPEDPRSMGNLVLLDYNNPSLWKDRFVAMKRVWDLDREAFFRGASIGRKLNKTQTGAITAAAMLYLAEDVLKRKQAEATESRLNALLIASAVRDERGRNELLNANPQGVGVFEFHGFNYWQGRSFSVQALPGLRGLLTSIADIQKKEGFNSIDGMMEYLPGYLRAFFAPVVTRAGVEFAGGQWDQVLLDMRQNGWGRLLNENEIELQGYDWNVREGVESRLGEKTAGVLQKADNIRTAGLALDTWLTGWQKASLTPYQRAENLKFFLGDLIAGLDGSADAAQNVERTGGIDARALDVERSGEWNADVLGGQSLEALVEQSSGLKGTIIRITPLTGLTGLLGIPSSR